MAPVASAGIAADLDGYLAGLTSYRLDLLSPWIRWLSATVGRTAGASTVLFERVEAPEAEWRGRVAMRVRADAAARDRW